MKHTIFLVHGMGVHQSNVWIKEITRKLKSVSKNYQFFKTNNLEDYVEFFPINYDNVINKILEEWKNAEDIVEFAKLHGLTDKKVFDYLKSLTDEEKKFLWEYVGDVIIYRFFPTYKNLIRISVIEQFAKKINQLIDSSGQAVCSVIAHSLGTIVAHDSLHKLGTEDWENVTNVLSPEHWKFNSIFMIANTSKLLESDIDPYKSIVKPGKSGDKDSYCYHYFNFWHYLDPVPNLKKFNPDWDKDYESIELNHFRKYNIHAFTHYLDNPKVHIPIFRSTVGFYSVLPDEENQAIQNYPQFGDDLVFGEDVKEFIEKLKKLLSGGGEDKWIEIILEFYKLVSKVKNKEF